MIQPIIWLTRAQSLCYDTYRGYRQVPSWLTILVSGTIAGSNSGGSCLVLAMESAGEPGVRPWGKLRGRCAREPLDRWPGAVFQSFRSSIFWKTSVQTYYITSCVRNESNCDISNVDRKSVANSSNERFGAKLETPREPWSFRADQPPSTEISKNSVKDKNK